VYFKNSHKVYIFNFTANERRRRILSTSIRLDIVSCRLKTTVKFTVK